MDEFRNFWMSEEADIVANQVKDFDIKDFWIFEPQTHWLHRGFLVLLQQFDFKKIWPSESKIIP